MKIAVGGIHIECCTFSPLLSQEADFYVSRGNKLLKNYPFFAEYPSVDFQPIIEAGALPGGVVERGFYERFKCEFMEELKKHAPWDGVYLPLHGALFVQGMEDAEGDFLSAVRRIVGDECMLAASYDLHGNVSQRVFDCLDFLTAYRTAPHVDWQQTQQRACAVLVSCIQKNIRPRKAFIPVPILLPGEQTSTEWEPAGNLYRNLPDVIQGEAVRDASILIGYVWADEPRSSAAVTAYGLDQAAVERAAETLAQRFWDVRHLFQFGVPTGSVDECIQMATNSKVQPVVISDSGDNPTAGGAGDTPVVLERLLALGVQNALVVGIADAEAVASCKAAGLGAKVDLAIGGKLDPVHARPLQVRGRIKSLHTPAWNLSREGNIPNSIAVVEIQNVCVVLTENRTTFHRLVDFTNLGINPFLYKVVVVKIGYLEPELKAMAAKALLAFSPGAVNQDIVHLYYQKIGRPMFPFDSGMEWTPCQS